jgi:hypothetical protein
LAFSSRAHRTFGFFPPSRFFEWKQEDTAVVSGHNRDAVRRALWKS